MKHENKRIGTRKGQRGFVLLTMAVAAVVLFGCLGLSVDVGRMYIAKNEAQAYADGAAVAACLKLDGTTAGVTKARTAATTLANNWNFLTTGYTGTIVEVATSSAGPWTNATTPPNPAANYSYVRVTANAPVKLYFIPMVTGTFSSTVNAAAVAGQILLTTSNEGLFPFAPIAFDGPTGGSHTTSPWGFVPGEQYTMRYDSSKKSACHGDDPAQSATGDPNHLAIGSDRGFWGANAVPTIDGQITGDSQEESLTIGQVLPGVGGAKTAVDVAIGDRIGQDGDTSDLSYASYLNDGDHNGRRLVYMPIQSEVDGTVLGFATFMLLGSGSYDHTGDSNWCALYVGTGLLGSDGAGANTQTGVYQVKLVQ